MLTSELLSKMTTTDPLSRHTVRLIQSGTRMKTLLDDLLDFSRASLGLGMAIRRAPVDLGAACADELDVLRAALPDCPIEFECEGDTEGSFDASRVREVLGNLVGNAARYCTPGTAVRVRLAGIGDKVSLSVENRGSPIPGETLNDLFEPLRRGNDPPSENLASRVNLGLGLFIVREVARAHGGEVQAVSGEGTTRFTVTLPRRA